MYGYQIELLLLKDFNFIKNVGASKNKSSSMIQKFFPRTSMKHYLSYIHKIVYFRYSKYVENYFTLFWLSPKFPENFTNKMLQKFIVVPNCERKRMFSSLNWNRAKSVKAEGIKRDLLKRGRVRIFTFLETTFFQRRILKFFKYINNEYISCHQSCE